MIPTRVEIQGKIYELSEDKRNGIESWLVAMGCPDEDREKILSDLETYENY